MSENRKYMVRMLTDFSTIGSTVGFCVFIGVFGGHYLDKWFDGKYEPTFTLIGLGFGVAAAFKNLYEIATRKDWDNEKGDRPKK